MGQPETVLFCVPSQDMAVGGVHPCVDFNFIVIVMDATFICARCSKPNAGPGNLPAGSCYHDACRGLLCEACSELHDKTHPAGHGFRWARDMEDGDPAATVSDIPFKPSAPPKPPTPAPAPAPAPSQASAEVMIAEMHSLHESIEAGVASVNAATSVRSLRCKCLCLLLITCTTRHNASLIAWRRRRQLYPSCRLPGAP